MHAVQKGSREPRLPILEYVGTHETDFVYFPREERKGDEKKFVWLSRVILPKYGRQIGKESKKKKITSVIYLLVKILFVLFFYSLFYTDSICYKNCIDCERKRKVDCNGSVRRFDGVGGKMVNKKIIRQYGEHQSLTEELGVGVGTVF